MKNKVFAIIGALLFVGAVVVANFADFAAATVIEIALAAFGLASVVISAIKTQKTKGAFSWKTILIIVLAVAAGVLVCIGGVTSNIFEQISGLVLALLAIITGLISAKNDSNAN